MKNNVKYARDLRIGSQYWNRAEDTLMQVNRITYNGKIHVHTVYGKHHNARNQHNQCCLNPNYKVSVESL